MRKPYLKPIVLFGAVAVLLLNSGVLQAGESQAPLTILISNVHVTLNESADDQNSTTIEVSLNTEMIASMDDIQYAVAEDSDGDIHVFTSDEFVQGAFDNRLVKKLPFLLSDTDVTVTIIDVNGNTHLFASTGKDSPVSGSRSAQPYEVIYDGSWSGYGDHYDVTFTVSGNRLTRFDITYDISCDGSGYYYTVGYSDWNPQSVAAGTFQLSGYGGTYTGTFNNASSLDGTWANNSVCDASGVWAATNGSASPVDPVPDPEPEPEPGGGGGGGGCFISVLPW